jgi:hypothetical protein
MPAGALNPGLTGGNMWAAGNSAKKQRSSAKILVVIASRGLIVSVRAERVA